jgi:hypothetical protein
MSTPGHLAKVGDEHLGCVIAAILGQSSRVLVYTTTDNQLRWGYLQYEGAVPQELQPAISEFDSLMTAIKTYVPERHQKIAYVNLGKSLFVALDQGQSAKITAAFKQIKDFVRTTSLEWARHQYVLAYLVSASLLSIIMVPLARYVTQESTVATLLWASIAGIAGASMSVLYRSHELALAPTSSRSFVILQGACRPILGALFGAFLVLACKGELLLALAKDHPLALYPLAAVAGFSERFIPEIMSHLEATP